MAKKGQRKWVKFRHKVITKLAYIFFYMAVRFKYGAKITKMSRKDKGQYLILFNHQTDYDQFFVGCAFRTPVYYIASEDLFSKGFISKLLKWAVAPIPIKKQSTDVRAVMNCIRVAKEGGTIALAPEGNRTYSGKTEHINEAICGLCKALKLPIAFFRIEEGYGVHPRWSNKPRHGKMRAYTSRVMQPEEYLNMDNAELYEIIKKELYVNEGTLSGAFKSNKRAEYLERAIYVCPHCGFSTFESHGNFMECKKCSLKIEYLETKQLKAVNGNLPFEFVTEWYDYQASFINSFDVRTVTEKPLYEERVTLYKVIPYKNKKKIESEAIVRLFGNRIVVEGVKTREFSFDEAYAFAVLGRNKLNVYIGKDLWQIKGSKRFNALKYVHFYYSYNNLKKGDDNVLFLGL